MNKLWKLWAWLTTDRICGWCKTRIHRAPIRLKPIRITNSIHLRRESHTVCPSCAAKFLKSV